MRSVTRSREFWGRFSHAACSTFTTVTCHRGDEWLPARTTPRFSPVPKNMPKIAVYSDYPESVLLCRAPLDWCQSLVDFRQARWISRQLSIRLRVPACAVIHD
jgi:hypothetical protein